jgi:uncharacterized protein (TIGR03435 family)
MDTRPKDTALNTNASNHGAGPSASGDNGHAAAADVSEPSGEMTISELLRRLGLKLESRKAKVDVLVIDHAERYSTEN